MPVTKADPGQGGLRAGEWDSAEKTEGKMRFDVKKFIEDVIDLTPNDRGMRMIEPMESAHEMSTDKSIINDLFHQNKMNKGSLIIRIY